MSYQFDEIIPKDPSEVVFWTGAGVSSDPPSNLPRGNQLTRTIVEHFCTESTWEEIIEYLERATRYDEKINHEPRLENILDQIVDILGYKVLENMKFLDAPPNRLHHFFAHHIKNQGLHITLNLDLCIENAIQDNFTSLNYQTITPSNIPLNIENSEPWILYLHNKFDSNYLQELGLTFGNIKGGLKSEIKKLLINTIKQKKVFLFIGYSGSDYFDVDPFFEELIQNDKCDLSNNIFIWMKRSKHGLNYLEKYSIYNKEQPNIRILNILSKSKAKIYIWWKSNKNQDELIDSLRNYWQFPIPNDNQSSQSEPIDIREYFPTLENWKREIITTNIWTSIGIGYEALPKTKYFFNQKIQEHKNQYRRYCQNNNVITYLTPEIKIYSKYIEAKREQGKYKDANILCQKMSKFILTEYDQLFYFERLGSGYWLMIHPLKANKELKKGLEYGKKLIGNDKKFDDLYIETFRAYVQLTRDINKIPVLGKKIVKNNCQYLYNLLKNNQVTINNALSNTPYDKSHLFRALTWEIKEIDDLYNFKDLLNLDNNDESIKTVFFETDNILGAINFKRSELKREISLKQNINKRELINLFKLSELIKDYPGMIKAYQIIAKTPILKKYNKGKLYSKIKNAFRKVQWNIFVKFLMRMGINLS